MKTTTKKRRPKGTATATNATPAAPKEEAATTEAMATTATKPAKVPGVAPTARTRAYYAGVVIRRHGQAAGVTAAMVAELNAAYGKPNDTESEICLRNAWHALRGYSDTTANAG
jgi:hypothetical protein